MAYSGHTQKKAFCTQPAPTELYALTTQEPLRWKVTVEREASGSFLQFRLLIEGGFTQFPASFPLKTGPTKFSKKMSLVMPQKKLVSTMLSMRTIMEKTQVAIPSL